MFARLDFHLLAEDSLQTKTRNRANEAKNQGQIRGPRLVSGGAAPASQILRKSSNIFGLASVLYSRSVFNSVLCTFVCLGQFCIQ